MTVIDERDYTHEAGEFLTERRFGTVFDAQVAPEIKRDFPLLYQYTGYKQEHAEMAVNELREAILFMGELYRNGEITYKQIVAQKL